MTRAVPFLDLNAQHAPLREELDAALERVISASNFVLGENVDRFEEGFARFCGVDHCVGLASGTDGLALILDTLGVGPGDEVITVANTFIATALGITRAGATPVLCDIDPASRNLDPALVEAAVTDRTRAIMSVHLYGYPADMGELAAIAKRHGLYLIEDACQAHGSEYRGRLQLLPGQEPGRIRRRRRGGDGLRSDRREAAGAAARRPGRQIQPRRQGLQQPPRQPAGSGPAGENATR
jgi:dTDP-4-amino-4,6-dideoxygalactose transaminase